MENSFFFCSQPHKIEQRLNPSLISLHIYKELPKLPKERSMQLEVFIMKLNWLIISVYYLAFRTELVN